MLSTMNPIALRLSAISLELEGCGMPEIVEALQIAEREIIRLEGRDSLTDTQIKHMVNRFLGWRLPENFQPDAGISFKPTFNDHMPFGPQKYNPIGTNLFTADQAEAMIRYLVSGLPKSTG